MVPQGGSDILCRLFGGRRLLQRVLQALFLVSHLTEPTFSFTIFPQALDTCEAKKLSLELAAFLHALETPEEMGLATVKRQRPFCANNHSW